MGDKEYSPWSPEETKVLIELLVDGVQRGWKIMNKTTVNHKILPVLNERLGCQKSHKHYLSRMKYLKGQYANYVELQRFSSGFGWDPVLKRFTASNEVWHNYLQAHPTHKYMQYESNNQFEDLNIIFNGATANGSFSVGLGDTTDARTYSVGDGSQVKENLNMFENNDDGCAFSSQQQSPEYVVSPHVEKLVPRKRSRKDVVGNSDEVNAARNDSMIDVSNKILSVIQQREERQQKKAELREEKIRLEVEKKKTSVWDAIKEVPNLDQRMKFKAVTLIYSLGMIDVFTEMSVEERYGWIESNNFE